MTDYRAGFYDASGALRPWVIELQIGRIQVFCFYEFESVAGMHGSALHMDIYEDGEPLTGVALGVEHQRQLVSFIVSDAVGRLVGGDDSGSVRSAFAARDIRE